MQRRQKKISGGGLKGKNLFIGGITQPEGTYKNFVYFLPEWYDFMLKNYRIGLWKIIGYRKIPPHGPIATVRHVVRGHSPPMCKGSIKLLWKKDKMVKISIFFTCGANKFCLLRRKNWFNFSKNAKNYYFLRLLSAPQAVC